MFKSEYGFSGFSVNNIDKAHTFYSGTLGLKAKVGPMGMHLTLPGGAKVFVYEKSDHEPATFTILNFSVNDIDQAFDTLKQHGVEFITYEGTTDQKGIARGKASGYGPDIAWFKDPAGNILSILTD